ncbi:MAG TPA: prolipoprotein diacylglyceryl transferase, partial [Roseiflexaceae bacterium]|nr:prolipoprotein diacylglyceryl transferase [Roseiflexaceae bacterium]
RRNRLNLPRWLDMCMPPFMLAQAVGRWGNFFNQEAYGRPTDLGFGVKIDQAHRLPPYDDMRAYPPDTLFHATFLYESLWNLAGFGLLIWIERRLRSWLRPADIALMYAIWYGAGRLWIEGLRTDSLCTSGIGGECEGALRAAQLASLLLIALGVAGLAWNHRRRGAAAVAATAPASAPEAPQEPPPDAPQEPASQG